MKNSNKYARGYFMPPADCFDWVKKEYIDKAPQWCSVDLRDGNQALITPMSLDEKIEFFKKLVEVGFKQIEIGFPAASETEYIFARTLIEQNLIPDDVTVQVLTQSREHIIKKTFEALSGAKNAIVHLYNSTSVSQREQVFKKDKAAVKQIAVDGAKMLYELSKTTKGNFMFEYSPESFTGTEPEFALEVCNAVLDELKPTPQRKVIINLPSTVQMSISHVYASQIEFMHKNLRHRDSVIISLHPHNDRGSAVTDAELGILAGGDRIEGTLFGNGERTGNVDIITVAMNMYMHGVDPGLSLENLPELVELYERLTSLHVNPRSPYSGALVFTAFSGSHQDAIAKGLNFRKETKPSHWTVPYLPIDPEDVGRNYDSDVIRINSQSGKGGIGYLMETKFGFTLPAKMREDFGYKVKSVSDRKHKELQPDEVFEIFNNEYVNISCPAEFDDYKTAKKDDCVTAEISYKKDGSQFSAKGAGNGVFDAASNALQKAFSVTIKDLTYSEHALEQGSKARAAAYVSITLENGSVYWAVGVDNDIITASIKALMGAINLAQKTQN